MNRKRITILSALIVLFVMLTLSACFGGRARGVANTGSRQVREHWTTSVRMENQMEGQYRGIQTDVNAGYQTVAANYQLGNQCFANWESVVTAAMEGRYDTSASAEGVRPGQLEGGAFIDAFLVNEAYPNPEVCATMLRDVQNDVRVWRADQANNFGIFFDMVREYNDHINDDIVKAMAVDFAQWLQQAAQEAGIPVPNYVYPTFNLTVETRDRNICDYYAQPGVRGDCTWNPALRNGTLIGQAAYEYMTRLFVAPEVSRAFDAGEDNLNPFSGQ